MMSPVLNINRNGQPDDPAMKHIRSKTHFFQIMLAYVVNDEAVRTNGFAVVKFLHTRVSLNAFPVITRRIQFSQMSTQNNAVYQQGNTHTSTSKGFIRHKYTKAKQKHAYYIVMSGDSY